MGGVVSLGELYDDLDEHLTATWNTGEGESATFTIDSLDKAEWAARKIARARRRLAEAEDLANAERTRIDQWLGDQQARCDQDCGFFEELLARFHRDRLADDPKARTIRLPSADLVARKRPDSIVVDESDEHVDATFAWCEANLPSAVVVRRSFDKNVLKRALFPSVDGEVGVVQARTSDGELVPGVAFKVGEVSFTVKTGDE